MAGSGFSAWWCVGSMAMDNEDIYAAVGKRIRILRRALDMTQTDLGRRCGISHQLVHKHEAGDIALSVLRLVSFARALDVPVALLLGLSDEAQPPRAAPQVPQPARQFHQSTN
jgi:transcriptional regulator with XRE-family HTH domain